MSAIERAHGPGPDSVNFPVLDPTLPLPFTPLFMGSFSLDITHYRQQVQAAWQRTLLSPERFQLFLIFIVLMCSWILRLAAVLLSAA
ncbi:hypothetical protein CF327_g2088 [Tilletia walkeri]|nr:hypothetical protein CF327_g2088 [Tilletia walkeri]